MIQTVFAKDEFDNWLYVDEFIFLCGLAVAHYRPYYGEHNAPKLKDIGSSVF